MNIEELKQQVSAAALLSGIEFTETHDAAAREGAFSPVPLGLASQLRSLLSETYPQGLYSHQSAAISTIIEGNDVCLATPTASGKSLIFMSAAAHTVLSSRHETVLALYPIKALIQDQKEKWRKLLEPLGIGVGYIDGSVDTSLRPGILARNRIILMTPDVLHAWLMGNLGKVEVAAFVENLRLLILDEAHTYSGVFGSNMAFLVRRLMCVSKLNRVVSSTATIGDPNDFVEKLTGRQAVLFDQSDDSTPAPERTIFLASGASGSFSDLTKFIIELSKRDVGKFLAFGDSRKLVETFVAATRRSDASDDDIEEQLENDLRRLEIPPDPSILPYRAGYEEEDRRQIQEALEGGELRGVVATSGLELGIDIGEVNTVVLLGTPPTIQSFRQRLGRVGRKEPGVCVLVDTKGLVSSLDRGLEQYLEREPEKAWLYLDNRFIQYTNALCAASERQSATTFNAIAFQSLPERFIRFLENEVEPRENLPDDLFSLKQRGQAGPHYEFPVRSGVEKNFNVRHRQGPTITPLGRLSESQMYREGYPGAVYYYIAKPFRVYTVNSRNSEIDVRNERFYTTKPVAQNTVFPKFPNGVFQILRSDSAFVAEAELQVSERILGFQEIRGNAKTSHLYEPGNIYRQAPMFRVFETTGVCWSVPGEDLMNETLALAIMEAFCLNYGIHTRDVGVGTFHSNLSPFGGPNVKGICIYDATNGSLRLTELLAENFPNVLSDSLDLLNAQEEFDEATAIQIKRLMELYLTLEPWSFGLNQQIPTTAGEVAEWLEVFAVGEKILHLNGGQLQTAFVRGHRFTPAGLMYQVSQGESYPLITTRADQVHAADEGTKTVDLNLYTGDIRRRGAP